MATAAMPSTTRITVAVRVRPLNRRETERGAGAVLAVKDSTRVTISRQVPTSSSVTTFAATETRTRGFTFDHVFDSSGDPSGDGHATQSTVWDTVGAPLLDGSMAGFNVSLFAYGQTGSGKTHSMVGSNEEPGIVPRMCGALFDRVALENQTTATDESGPTFKVEVSMLEIYNERIRDLLVPPRRQQSGGLKVRDAPKTGAYVEGLKAVPVSTTEQLTNIMAHGTRARTFAATNMNETSSRAHTIVLLHLTQSRVDESEGAVRKKTSKINLIDLAGSERVAKSGAAGDRLKEAGHINQSLSALGHVISSLAHNAKIDSGALTSDTVGFKPTHQLKHVPYRDSALTHLLKDSLGGNAVTTMLAALSPADSNYDETLSTLRYADRAKHIMNKAVVNEDVSQRIIRELRAEVELLREQLAAAQSGTLPAAASPDAAAASGGGGDDDDSVAARMAEYERTLAEMAALDESDTVGLTERPSAAGVPGDGGDADYRPYLSNLNEDPSLSGVLRYRLDDGVNSVGTNKPNTDATPAESRSPPTVVLGGLGIAAHHATLELKASEAAGGYECGVHAAASDGAHDDALPPRTCLNGQHLSPGATAPLKHNDRLVFGNNATFRYVVPILETTNGDEGVDWEFAVAELNREVLSAFAAGRADGDARDAAARHELETRLAALKEELEQERGATESNADRVERLEHELREQRDAAAEFARRHSREAAERSALDEDLLRLLPLVHEANTIAAAIGRPQRFSVKLVTAGSVAAGAGTTTAATTLDPMAAAAAARTEAAVLVSTGPAATTPVLAGAATIPGLDDDEDAVMWSTEKFHSRIFLMREAHALHLQGQLEYTGDSDERDPFYDPPADRLVGSSRIQLEAVNYLLDVDEATPVIDYKGTQRGQLKVAIVPSCPDAPGGLDSYEEVGQLDGRRLVLNISVSSFVPTPLFASKLSGSDSRAASLYASFTFFVNHKPFRTKRVHIGGSAIALDDHAGVTITETVTPELCKYLMASPLVFELFTSGDAPGGWDDEAQPQPQPADADDGDSDGGALLAPPGGAPHHPQPRRLAAALEAARTIVASASADSLSPRVRQRLMQALGAAKVMGEQAVVGGS